jgi:hypothetical protein
MPLTTQCERCGRRFPVYAQELREGRGGVDCPQCGRRFDAVAALLDEPPRGLGVSNVPARLAAERLGPATAEPTHGSQGTRGTAVAWGLLALLLLLALSAQLLWWKRGELLRDPAARQALEGLCEALGCQVPAPRLPGTLTLLDPTLTAGPEDEALMLRLKVRNEADLAQPAPTLELELFDLHGDLAAVRRFSPSEYAPRAPRLLEPRTTLEVALSMVKPGPGPAGFKVRLL